MLAITLLAATTSGCAVRDISVTRVVDGREVSSRFVSVEAYRAYVRGAYLEARGDLIGARAAYQLALEQDPDSVHIWTRIGALLCHSSEARAQEAFRSAAELDRSYRRVDGYSLKLRLREARERVAGEEPA